MKALIVFVIIFGVFFLGAVSHEFDMANNYARCGDAKAWFFDIKVPTNDN